MSIPVHTIDVSIKAPFTDFVTMVADTGSKINAINTSVATSYSEKIKKFRKPAPVHTGNGWTYAKHYVDLDIDIDNKLHKVRFLVKSYTI